MIEKLYKKGLGFWWWFMVVFDDVGSVRQFLVHSLVVFGVG